MRPVELTLLVLLLAWVAAALAHVRRARPWQRWFLAAIALAAVAHILLEGWRLQIAPAYFAILFVGLSALNVSDLATRVFLASFVAVCAVFSLIAAYAFPVIVLPEPHGPYAIGTFIAHLVDRSRPERHSDVPGAPREFMIQVWYPAEHVKGKRAWYRDPRMNTWRSDHLRLVKTHSFWDLPAAKQAQTFPVLLFGPSSGGNRDQNTFEVEELVSQGYVVVGMDFPYSCSRVVFPDGRVAHSLPIWMDSSTPESYRATVAGIELMLQDHVNDARYVLNELERWNRAGSGHLLAGRLNLARTGVFGHSFGGALAAALCRADSRVVAGINMDGWLFSEAEREGVPKPFLYMYSDETWAPDPAVIAGYRGGVRREADKTLLDWRREAETIKRFGGYRLHIVGSGHGNYSDIGLFTRPLPFQSHPRLNNYRAFQIIDAFTLAFFDRYLRDRAAPLLDQGGYPGEVQYERFSAPAAEARSF